MRGELRLAGMSVSVSRLDNGLPQAGDPLLLAEGVIGLQAVGVSFRPPSAAHTETVLHFIISTSERSSEGTPSTWFSIWDLL